MSTIINATTTNGVVIQPDNSGSLVLQTNSGQTAVTINTSQNVAFAKGFTVGATAAPTFSAYQSSSQTGIANNTYTKIIFQTEEWDTNSNYDNATNYRFTPTIAGYYQVNAGVAWLAGYSTAILSIYKNGSAYKDGTSIATTTNRSAVNGIVYCNGSTDYIEIYGYQSSGGSASIAAAIQYTYFQAAMVRSA